MSFVTSFLFLFSIVGFAHDGGHGPIVTGLGPNGGSLTAIIQADQAQLGEQAKAVALAEWIVKKQEVQMHLWSLDSSKLSADGAGKSLKASTPYSEASLKQKPPFTLLEKGSMKWIILRKGQKPEVISAEIAKGQAKFSLKLKNFQMVSAIEAILQKSEKEKLVTLKQLSTL